LFKGLITLLHVQGCHGTHFSSSFPS
jgi:hypothetical protein